MTGGLSEHEVARSYPCDAFVSSPRAAGVARRMRPGSGRGGMAVGRANRARAGARSGRMLDAKIWVIVDRAAVSAGQQPNALVVSARIQHALSRMNDGFWVSRRTVPDAVE